MKLCLWYTLYHFIKEKVKKMKVEKVKRNKWRNLREMVKWWQTGRLQGMD
jgi:hypothetical protein